MKIRVNGEDLEIAGDPSVEDLLAHLDVRAGSVAVERNGLIVPRSTFSEAALEEGDEIEIVTFVGGG